MVRPRRLTPVPGLAELRLRLVGKCDHVRSGWCGAGFVAGSVLCAVGARLTVDWAFVMGWVLLFVASLLRPRWSLVVLLSFVLFFTEERWQIVLLGGTPGPAPTSMFSFHVSALTVQFALCGGLVLGALLRIRKLQGTGTRWGVAALCLLLVAILWGELLGRLTTAGSPHLFGEWSLLATPLVVGVASLWLLNENDVQVGVRLLFGLAIARVALGLARYGLGGGDWNYEFHRRIVFWDTADGFASAAVAIGGLGLLLRPGPSPRALRVCGAIVAVAGLVAVALSLRRESLVLLATSVVVLVALLWRTRLKVLVPSLVALLVVLALGGVFLQSSNGLLAARIRSMNPLDHASASATNVFHVEDVRNAVLLVADRPILGWGFYSTPPPKSDYLLFMRPALATINTVHNMYLDLWLRTGVLGFVSLGALLATGFWRGWAARRRYLVTASILVAILAGFALEGCFGPTLDSYRLPYFLVAAVVSLCVLSDGLSDPSLTSRQGGSP